MLETAYRLVDAFNAWDEDRIIRYRTENCVHEFWPAGATPGHDNRAARAHFLATKDLFRNFHVEIIDHVEDTAASRVVFFARATMDSPKGEIELHYVLLLDIAEEMGKIRRIVQMNHPKFI